MIKGLRVIQEMIRSYYKMRDIQDFEAYREDWEFFAMPEDALHTYLDYIQRQEAVGEPVVPWTDWYERSLDAARTSDNGT